MSDKVEFRRNYNMFLRSRNVQTPPPSAEIPPSDTSTSPGAGTITGAEPRGFAKVIDR